MTLGHWCDGPETLVRWPSDIGPVVRDIGPVLRDIGPVLRDIGPVLRDIGAMAPHIDLHILPEDLVERLKLLESTKEDQLLPLPQHPSGCRVHLHRTGRRLNRHDNAPGPPPHLA